MAGRVGGRDRFPESRGGHGLRRLDSKSGKAPPSRNLWVGNLSHSVVEEDLVNPFLQFGELESVAFHPGRSYAFLKFKGEDDAIAAMDSLQGLLVAGNPLRIEFTKATKGDGALKKIRKPKPWKHPQPLTKSQLLQMREEFWDTAPHYGGRKEIWDALRAASEADLSLAQAIVDSAGVIVQSADLTICYDERGAKYELPKYVLSEPTNLIQES